MSLKIMQYNLFINLLMSKSIDVSYAWKLIRIYIFGIKYDYLKLSLFFIWLMYECYLDIN